MRSATAPYAMGTIPGSRGQRGLSLVELMVAMVISLILLAGIAQIFISNKGTYAVDEQVARLQENGRLSFNTLSRDVRLAGLSGCNAGQVTSMLDNPTEDFFSPEKAVTGYEYTADATGPGDTYDIPSGFAQTDGSAGDWTGTEGDDLPADLVNEGVLPGSDVIVLQRANSRDDIDVEGNNPPNNANIQVDGSTGVESGQILMISDCTAADIFQNTNNETASNLNAGSGAGGNEPGNVNPNTDPWHNGQGWDSNANVFEMTIRAFFIGRDEEGRPALRAADFSHGSDPEFVTLAPGVENMQIVFGVDTALPRGSANAYMTAQGINNAPNVTPRDIVSTKIHLLVRSSDDLPGEADTDDYILAQTTIDPQDDTRLREVFGTTIAVRNRIIAQK